MNQEYVIEDAHLIALIKHAETEYKEEMKGRNPQWPSTAALAYWDMAQTCQRFLTLPHNP